MVEPLDTSVLVRRLLSGMTDKQLEKIGFAIIVWNGIERQLSACIWRLAGWAQDVGEIVTAEMGNEARPTLLVNLARQTVRDDLLREQIELAGDAFRTLRDFRNELAHGAYAWGFDNRQPPGILFKFNANRTPATGEVRKTTINVNGKQTDELIADLLLLGEFLPDLERTVREHHEAIAEGVDPASEALRSRVHGWRAPSVDISPLQEMMMRRKLLRTSKRHPSPPRSSQA